MSSFPRNTNPRVDEAAVLARIAWEGAAARLSLAEATALIASRTKDRDHTEREARNRVRMQICRALEAGASHASPPEDGTCLVAGSDERIAVDELIRWATVKYGKRFGGLPKKALIINVNMEERLGINGHADDVVLPGSPERKDTEILRLNAEIRRLESEAASAEERRKERLVARFKSK